MRSEELVLDLRRLLVSPRERVFRLFTDPASMAQWWGPTGFSVPSIDFNPRVGGTFRIEMQPPEGDAFELTGIFHEVDPPSRLSFSFRWRPSDPDDVETVAYLTFEAIDDSTDVWLRQQPFKTEARRALHRNGWSQSFDKLAELVAAQP